MDMEHKPLMAFYDS